MRAKNRLLCPEKEPFQNIDNTFSIDYQIILVCIKNYTNDKSY